MYDHAQVTKDAPKDIVIAFDDNSITLEKKDPFGHVSINLAKGTLPERYQGAYTSFSLAEHYAKEYIEQYKKAKEEVLETIPKKLKKVHGKTESDSGREQLR